MDAFPPNGFGLYDVGGNVWQRCSDWYRPDYYATVAASAAPEPGDSALHAGVEDSVANLLRRVEDSACERCLAALLDQDRRDQRLVWVLVIERLVWTRRSGGTISR